MSYVAPPSPPRWFRLPTLRIEGNDTIVIEDGYRYKYAFRDRSLLQEACTARYFPPGRSRSDVEYNNDRLALIGDGIAALIMRERFRDSDSPTITYRKLYEWGMGMNAYQAYIAEVTGVIENALMLNGMSASHFLGEESKLSQHDKASALEAIFGAVWEDSKASAELELLMAQLGVYWPQQKAQEPLLQDFLDWLRVRGLLRKT